MDVQMKRIQDGWDVINLKSSCVLSALSLAPDLEKPSHKGSSGRLGILGGSLDYHGAPGLAAMAALRTGADMVEIFTVLEIAPSVRSVSPDLIVHPWLARRTSPTKLSSLFNVNISTNCVKGWNWPDEVFGRDVLTEAERLEADISYTLIAKRLPTLHALIVGPGLGEDELSLSVARRILLTAYLSGLPLIIDADGIRMLLDPAFASFFSLFTTPVERLSERLQFSNGNRGSAPVILTPNAREFRLLSQYFEELAATGSTNNYYLGQRVHASETEKPGLFSILEKGAEDVLWTRNTNNTAWITESLTPSDYNSSRRCAGQGDLLAGILGCFMGWLKLSEGADGMLKHIDKAKMPLLGDRLGNTLGRDICLTATALLRTAAIRAYYNYYNKSRSISSVILAPYSRGRGVVSSDIVEEIAASFQVLGCLIRCSRSPGGNIAHFSRIKQNQYQPSAGNHGYVPGIPTQNPHVLNSQGYDNPYSFQTSNFFSLHNDNAIMKDYKHCFDETCDTKMVQSAKRNKKKSIFKGSGWFADNWNNPARMTNYTDYTERTTTTKSSDSQ